MEKTNDKTVLCQDLISLKDNISISISLFSSLSLILQTFFYVHILVNGFKPPWWRWEGKVTYTFWMCSWMLPQEGPVSPLFKLLWAYKWVSSLETGWWITALFFTVFQVRLPVTNPDFFWLYKPTLTLTLQSAVHLPHFLRLHDQVTDDKDLCR